MADDETTPEATPPAAPAPDDRVASLEALINSQAAQIQGLTDVVQSALVSRPVTGAGGAPSIGRITPELRNALRQRGASDADIDRNGPLIMPFIEVFAPELIGLVEGRVGPLAETLSLSEMAQDTDAYPYAKGLKSEIKKLIGDAKKEGRQLSPEAAYHTAVSMDVGQAADKSKVRQIDATRRAESAGGDASATSGIGHRGSSNQGARATKVEQPRDREALSRMSREDRMKWYETNGDVPIQ